MVPLNLSASTSVASKSGDAQSPFDAAFQYNASFQVGGSGTQTQTQAATQDKSSGAASSNVILYIALGVVGLVAIAALISAPRS